MFPDTVDKLPEMTDQQPLYVESTVLRQLPHFGNSSKAACIELHTLLLGAGSKMHTPSSVERALTCKNRVEPPDRRSV